MITLFFFLSTVVDADRVVLLVLFGRIHCIFFFFFGFNVSTQTCFGGVDRFDKESFANYKNAPYYYCCYYYSQANR